MAGIWTPLTNQPLFSAGTMLLLTDGTVMCQDNGAANWWRLTPDSKGDYIGGSWSPLAAGPNAPLYFASAVLKDGRVFVAGGEYDNGNQVDLLAAEIFDPVTNSWTVIGTPNGWVHLGDAPSCVLPDGRVLVGSIDDVRTAIYDPVANAWVAAGNKGDSSSEETFTLLPDGTILSVQCSTPPNAEKYIIASDKWVSAGTTPSPLLQPCPGVIGEIGPALLLPDGRVFAIGASGNTASYKPPSNPSQPGRWISGPTLSDANGNTLFPMDAPGCLLPNGKVLLCASPGPACQYPAPTTFFEYDPSSNSVVRIASPANATGPCYNGRMLLLPSSQVLFASASNDVEAYTPDGAPQAAWKPQITNAPSSVSANHTYVLQGRQLNGLSQAVSYGDDAQMATNYPLVCVRNVASGQVVFCRTFDHSTMGVATGNVIHSTRFSIPPGVQIGASGLFVVANGVWSDPVSVNVTP